MSEGGGVNTLSYTIAGTTSTIIAALDNVSVSMDLGDASTLLGTEAVPRLTVFLKSTGDTARVAAILAAASAGGPSAGGALEAASGLTFRTWEDLSPYYRQASSVYRMILAVARLIVLVVALFSISGTLSLAILERLREIGTLRTFGSRRSHVVAMFLVEGLALGLVGVLVGAALGWGGVAEGQRRGRDDHAPPAGDELRAHHTCSDPSLPPSSRAPCGYSGRGGRGPRAGRSILPARHRRAAQIQIGVRHEDFLRLPYIMPGPRTALGAQSPAELLERSTSARRYRT